MEHDVIKAIESLKNMYHLKPALPEDVALAEQRLELRFAEDYRTYVLTYGAISAQGIELTGVTSAKRLDVVNVTLQEREMSSLPENVYVLEDVGMDGLLILQDQTGAVFSVAPHKPVKRICKSLTEYIQQVQKQPDQTR